VEKILGEFICNNFGIYAAFHLCALSIFFELGVPTFPKSFAVLGKKGLVKLIRV